MRVAKQPKSPDEWKSFFDACHSPSASATVQGKLLTYKVKRPTLIAPGSTRGVIRDFSPAARLRMLKRFYTINWDDYWRPIFITLTYPDDFSNTTREERNIHRKVMARHLEKLTGLPLPAAWRIEWEPRKSGKLIGVPCAHHHWLVFRHRFIDCTEVNRLWKMTIGSNTYTRTETKGVDASSATQLYMAKYISKDACPLSLVIAAYQNSVGRQYGWLRPSLIPRHEERAYSKLSRAERDTLCRLANEQLPWLADGWEQSFTLMGGSADDAGRILEGEVLDGA